MGAADPASAAVAPDAVDVDDDDDADDAREASSPLTALTAAQTAVRSLTPITAILTSSYAPFAYAAFGTPTFSDDPAGLLRAGKGTNGGSVTRRSFQIRIALVSAACVPIRDKEDKARV